MSSHAFLRFQPLPDSDLARSRQVIEELLKKHFEGAWFMIIREDCATIDVMLETRPFDGGGSKEVECGSLVAVFIARLLGFQQALNDDSRVKLSCTCQGFGSNPHQLGQSLLGLIDITDLAVVWREFNTRSDSQFCRCLTDVTYQVADHLQRNRVRHR